MKVKDVMNIPVHIIALDEPISRARNLMLKHNISRLVVIEKQKPKEDNSKPSSIIPVGVVTKTDISQRLNQAEPEWRRRPIDNIPINLVMTSDFITIYPDATVSQAAEILLENNISGLPVVKSESDKSIIGILTEKDIVGYYSTLDNMISVKDIMDDFFLVVHKYHTVTHVIREMNSNEIDRVIVVDNDHQPVGIITRTNLAMNKILDSEGGPTVRDIKIARKNRIDGERMYRYVKDESIVAEDIMSTPVISVSENSRAVEAAKIMFERRISGLPVVNEKIEGVITARKILQAVIEQ
jgi:CBS domain-containing protein